MTILIYDGTYQGWLTGVFEIYEYKFEEVKFAKNNAVNIPLFANMHQIVTNDEKAKRVFKGLQEKLKTESLKRLYKTFLSEINQFEDIMWRFVKYTFSNNKNIEGDFGNPIVWDLRTTAKMVEKEAHRMTAFVRFQLTTDELYYTVIEPDHDVLSLISGHFKRRYADQRWLIYDGKRKYGIYYDLENVNTIQLEFNTGTSSKCIAEILDEKEDAYQLLWKTYFKSVNIPSRKNLKLQMQHMPKRYWKHLTEKMLDI